MTMPPQFPDLMTRPEAASYLGLKPQTLASWAVTGTRRVPYYKVVRLVKYRRADLDAWLASRMVRHTGETPSGE